MRRSSSFTYIMCFLSLEISTKKCNCHYAVLACKSSVNLSERSPSYARDISKSLGHLYEKTCIWEWFEFINYVGLCLAWRFLDDKVQHLPEWGLVQEISWVLTGAKKWAICANLAGWPGLVLIPKSHMLLNENHQWKYDQRHLFSKRYKQNYMVISSPSQSKGEWMRAFC